MKKERQTQTYGEREREIRRGRDRQTDIRREREKKKRKDGRRREEGKSLRLVNIWQFCPEANVLLLV